MSETRTTLDVREIDGEPFDHIQDALADLGEDESLRLVADFEPVPLYGVLESRGFTHESEQTDDAWHVHIERA